MYKFVYLYKQTFIIIICCFNLNSNNILLYNKFQQLIYSYTIYLLPLEQKIKRILFIIFNTIQPQIIFFFHVATSHINKEQNLHDSKTTPLTIDYKHKDPDIIILYSQYKQTLKQYFFYFSSCKFNFKKPDLQQQFAQITIYTDKHVYENILKIKHINQQLTWNTETINTIQQTLMGKREKIDIMFKPIKKNSFNNLNNLAHNNKIDKQNIKIKQVKQQPQPTNYMLQIICEIKTGINLTLFSLQMPCISCSNPFSHLKSKLSSLNHKISSILSEYKQQQTRLKQQNNTIESLQKQIKSSSKIQIQYMKNNFVTVINQCKQEIKKYIGNQNINLIGTNINNIIKNNHIKNNLTQIQQNHQQYHQEEQDQQSLKQQRIKKRQIKKINRKIYNQVRPKKMQIQKQFSHLNNYQQQSESNQKQHQYNQKFIRYKNNDSSSQQEKEQHDYQKHQVSQYRQQQISQYRYQKQQHNNFNGNNNELQNKQSKQNEVNWDQLFD